MYMEGDDTKGNQALKGECAAAIFEVRMHIYIYHLCIPLSNIDR